MSGQEQFLDVIDRDEAQRRFHAALNLAPVGVEPVRLAEALGRILAEDVAAAVDVPSFDRSNVDGFAVRAADTFGASEEVPRRLELLPEPIATADVPSREVEAGQAAAIATGGMLPRGADAVVMVEHTDAEAGALLVRRAVAAGANVTFAATDISTGECVVHGGTLLTSRETGVLAAVGAASVNVYRRPRIAVISTGDEIIEPGQPMRPGLVYDSNAQIVADAIRELGGEPIALGIVSDDLSALRKKVRQALATCDVVLLSGGTSKGAGDLSYRAVSELADPGIVAHGVALKPGKPICLAVTGGKPVVVLPGFPTSAIFTFHEFVAPVIRRLTGQVSNLFPEGGKGQVANLSYVQAELAVKVNSEIGRTEFLLVGLVERTEGGLAAYPMGKGSGSVTTFSRADGFITIGRHQELVQQGTTVDVQLLGRDLKLADLVVIGSHCIGLDLILSRLHRQGIATKFLAVGSLGGLDAARRGECDLAGIHLLDPATGQYNRPFLTPELELIPGYGRMQGIAYRPGDRRFAGRNVNQAIAAALADPKCVMVNRNRGSGTRVLIDGLLAGAQPAGYAVQPRNHSAVAAAVVQGRADWGVCIEHVARQAALEFIPITEERYDVVAPKSRVSRPGVIAFRELLSSDEIRRELARLGFVLSVGSTAE